MDERREIFAGATTPLTRGVTLEETLLNFYGKAAAPTKGRDGNSHFGVLDKVRGRIDDTGNEDFARWQLHRFPHLPLVRVARVGGLDRIGPGAHLEYPAPWLPGRIW